MMSTSPVHIKLFPFMLKFGRYSCSISLQKLISLGCLQIKHIKLFPLLFRFRYCTVAQSGVTDIYNIIIGRKGERVEGTSIASPSISYRVQSVRP